VTEDLSYCWVVTTNPGPASIFFIGELGSHDSFIFCIVLYGTQVNAMQRCIAFSVLDRFLHLC
jgi:hypothetical protein